MHAVFYCELRDERLLRVRTFFDLYGAAVELGMLPRAGTARRARAALLRGFGVRSR